MKKEMDINKMGIVKKDKETRIKKAIKEGVILGLVVAIIFGGLLSFRHSLRDSVVIGLLIGSVGCVVGIITEFLFPDEGVGHLPKP